MNDRDRLVELLKDFKIKCNKLTCERNYNCQAHGFEQFADYLIANGATFKKRGEWFLLDECSNEGVYCSVCHKKVYDTHYARQKVKSKFCPNCGARMDGQRKENGDE